MTGDWPLTPLEEYFLLEDRPAYPWSFFVRLGLTGCADRQAAEKALRHCVARHPLLSSIARQQRDGSWIWQRVPHPQPVVRWTTGTGGGKPGTGTSRTTETPVFSRHPLAASPISSQLRTVESAYPSATHLDVTAEIGIRLHAAAGPDSTQFVFQFHHACCDARGAFTLVDDWLAEYARATGGEQEIGPPRVYDPSLLERRSQFRSQTRQTVGPWSARWGGLVRAYRFLRQTPVPLLDYQPARDQQPAPEGFPAARSFRFDVATTAAFCSAAKRQGATVNDLLCRDLLLALRDFRRELQPQQPDAWLRLAVPVDLRTEAQEHLSAANQASLVFVTRRASVCHAADSLLQSIHRELQQVKAGGLARTFLRSLEIRKRLPGGLARSVRNGKCGATAAMTNVGETLGVSRLPRLEGRLVAGNLLLDSADFLAPIRPLTCASFSACTYAGRLAISLQYDPQALSERAADQLFETFLGHLQNSLR